MTGIVTLPLVPLRTSQSEQSEMISQLLFGERVEIVETYEHWFLVKNPTDMLEGFADRRMIKILTSEQAREFTDKIPHCISVPLLACTNNENENMILPGGSLLPNYVDGKSVIIDETFTIKTGEQALSGEEAGDHFCWLAKQYLNAPYLSGGKSIFGIDASGLIQVVFSIGGIALPRNAAQQVEFGQVIDFLSEVKAGDLAFFENTDGKISHVGIMLNPNQIIHASGYVKIDSIDYQGIISSTTGEYSHKLRVIKRII